jgi:hypothetical protein
MPDELQPQIAGLIDEVTALQQRVEAMFRAHAADRLALRPAPNRWSPAECISHLNLTAKMYVPLLHTEIRRARDQRIESNGPFTLDWTGRFLTWFLEPPYRVRTRTLPAATPVGARSPAVVFEESRALHAQIASLMQEANGIALDQVVVTSPFSGRLKYNLYSVFRVITAHERRHLWQAEQVLGAP